jgi:hypothetical protein
VHGLLFLVRSGGFAFNEVVLALLAAPGARRTLVRFGLLLGAGSSAVLFALSATPLAELWFRGVSGLPPELARLAASAALLGVVWPFSQALQSWYQGALVFARLTRHATEAMGVFFVVAALVLAAGVHATSLRGAPCAVLALTLASLAQTAWLAWRHRSRATLASSAAASGAAATGGGEPLARGGGEIT